MNNKIVSRVSFVLFAVVSLFVFFIFNTSIGAQGPATPVSSCENGEVAVIDANDGLVCEAVDDVILEGITGCVDGQVLFRQSNGVISCKADSTTNVPDCTGNEFLTEVGGVLTCAAVPPGLPTCGTGQYLVYNSAGTDATCTDVPSCDGGQYIVYSDTGPICASVPSAASDDGLFEVDASFNPHIIRPVVDTRGLGGAAFFYTSDRNKKENIKELENSIEKIRSLNGYSFAWKNNGFETIGLIAQEVEEVYPEIVSGKGTEDGRSVDYASLIAPMIESIKYLAERVEEQEKEIGNLKKIIESR